MDSYARTIDNREESEANSRNAEGSQASETMAFDPEAGLGAMAGFIVRMIERFFGFTIGAGIGWYGGRIAGAIITRYFGSVHLYDLDEIIRFEMMPYAFAKYGVIAGAILGVIIIALLDHNSENTCQ